MIHCEIEDIGPREAHQLLRRNDKNRRPRPRNIEKFARDMSTGRWVLNGETIVVADSGRLLNGQNRLLAVVKSGVTIRVIVVRGVPEEAFKTIDQGSKRSIGDALWIAGEEHAKDLSSSVTNIWRYYNLPDKFAAYQLPTEAEVEQMLLEYPEIRESVKFCLAHKVGGLQLSRAATLHFLFSTLDDADTEDFFLALSTGANLSERHPVLKLRELLVSNYGAKKRYDTVEIFAVAIKAWNLYRDRREVSSQGLRWRSHGPAAEPFPEPH